MSEASSYVFRRSHGRRACWELARYLRVLPPSTMSELVEDLAHVLRSGVYSTELHGGWC
jgi:hypothetical protein